MRNFAELSIKQMKDGVDNPTRSHSAALNRQAAYVIKNAQEAIAASRALRERMSLYSQPLQNSTTSK